MIYNFISRSISVWDENTFRMHITKYLDESLSDNKDVDALCQRKSPILFSYLRDHLARQMDYVLATIKAGRGVRVHHVFY